MTAGPWHQFVPYALSINKCRASIAIFGATTTTTTVTNRRMCAMWDVYRAKGTKKKSISNVYNDHVHANVHIFCQSHNLHRARKHFNGFRAFSFYSILLLLLLLGSLVASSSHRDKFPTGYAMRVCSHTHNARYMWCTKPPLIRDARACASFLCLWTNVKNSRNGKQSDCRNNKKKEINGWRDAAWGE